MTESSLVIITPKTKLVIVESMINSINVHVTFSLSLLCLS